MMRPRKRMLLTLPYDVHATLQDFAALTGVPAATYVAHILKELQPQMQAVLVSITHSQGRKLHGS